ncbi:AzlD domain-containing protein [Vibrio mexicanus]|uniref:AzlD domain-containing protein n=1 Tax=Vibrio mexicanus TaxID=1004326 RepID=UPI00063C1EA6|nr:AzlD domain-containing protein [Vibrio mexicanus]
MSVNIYGLIFLMAAITFSCRYLFLMRKCPIVLSDKARKALEYTAPSVLTAMWVPIVFFGHQTTQDEFVTSPFLYAGLLTLLVAAKVKNTLVVVTIGMGVFGLLQVLSKI